ncbi:hypothetical protein ISN45_At02g002780 [Arabidopsis thaliana x Arabidopsis arenosa]|jgi:hypothetical protein|uniref:18S pre-ribosomal assembly protein gar2-like protein n=3 Tax=Arabidopsis TaxID=3701 RepID=F4ITB8_ARATH|nr:18S pre-ribosomal assembly protein gar2-like protein [Arabidopsis thaliana]NP_001118260.1 18S pre-ribosomal assembly protein gar2-like protein [Arabidopsis thaliana]NP_001318194.1 18S pre-ribosomal assembly protein gar2-like protein [Arabidopsis thaliana]NP_001324260.1 18S pre-ribosomal assembly protein gar2-like protein [Arabidopsis thaliana]NP_001324261.1 18S pre-ribosomal assembly protein gar2-like protein [Arabidopsis thaliana]NP_178475.2 18S pre-ribosomal assembly protein gar2-like pro|eukprot:NP_001030966.1 18S pre-ribosomal assembly protein gar2-like protein [Arabidopsis thaliana]
MRADNDHALGNSIEICKDESKPHQCLDENWEDAELKVPENGKNNNNVCELFYDTRSGEEWENEAGKKVRDTSHDCDANVDSPEKKDPVFYMDKNVTACDLPEIVVCYKENTYHIVKDICVDEGVPVQEKFLFGEKDSVKSSSTEDLMKADKTNVNPSETKSAEDSISKVDDSEFCNDHKTDRDVEESSGEDFADAEGTSSNYNQEHLIVTEEVKASPTHGLSPSEIEPDENSKDEVAISQDNDSKECLTLGDILSREDEQKSLNQDNISSDSHEEQSPSQLQDKEKRSLETTAIETELEKTEEPKQGEEKLSSVSTTTSQEPNKTCNEPEKPETENHHQQNCLVENSYEDDKFSSSRFGETSFSAADSVSISGHITYSGPIAYSGSLSVRSDASTTSGRSFAFPILQSEWNSSPVRMAKADKRRQKGGWRHTLLCCRFS